MKQELLDAFSPGFVWKPGFWATIFPDDPGDGTTINHFAEVEVEFNSGEHVTILRESIDRSPNRSLILREIADDVTSQLKRAMELFGLVENADAQFDSSYSDQPSISPHSQNSGFRHWTVLIELVRDGWGELASVDQANAKRLVERWKSISYPIFRRLCLYAMTESDLYTEDEGVEYLLENDGWWIWSYHLTREKFRLLDRKWSGLSAQMADRLVETIALGPPRTMFRDDVPDGEFREIADRERWLLLTKLSETGRSLPEAGQTILTELSSLHPDWRIAPDERNEFVIWSAGGFGEVPVESPDDFVNSADNEVLAQLSGTPPTPRTTLVRWTYLVAQDPRRGLKMLDDLADSAVWPADIWSIWLDSFSSADAISSLWPVLAGVLANSPDTLIGQLSRSLANLLGRIGKLIDKDQGEIFWRNWDRVQPFAFVDDGRGSGNDPLSAALNSAAGHMAQALIDGVITLFPQPEQKLPDEILGRLTTLSGDTSGPYQLARVILASRLAWLHAKQPAWAETHLLPFFAWDRCPEAPSVWQGFLWQPRITPELWPSLKPSFLLAVRHAESLGRAAEQIDRIFAFICLDRSDWISHGEAREILRSVTTKTRARVASVVWKRLEGAEAKADSLWSDLIAPWLEEAWPKDVALIDSESALYLATAVTYLSSAFRSGVEAIARYLTTSVRYALVVNRLLASDHPSQSHAATLRLLHLIVDSGNSWPDATKLRAVLERVKQADASLTAAPAFRALDEYLTRFNA